MAFPPRNAADDTSYFYIISYIVEILASFGHFSITAASISSRSLATVCRRMATILVPPPTLLPPHAPRPTLHASRSTPLAPHAPRPTLHAPRLMPHQRGQVVLRLFPAGYCHLPTTELAKTERGPILTSGPSIFSMSPKFSMLPNQAISSDKSIRFSQLAAARSLSIRAWPDALERHGSKRACRMATYRNDRTFRLSPRPPIS